jgi:hypothetical protein
VDRTAAATATTAARTTRSSVMASMVRVLQSAA